MDVVGENKYLYLTQENKNKRFESSSMAYMYNDGNPIDFTLSIGSFTDSAGNDYSSNKDQYFTINGNQVNINIPEGSLSFENDAYYKIVLIGTPTSTSVSSQVRQAEIQLFGLVRGADGKPGDNGKPGENAVSYDIKTSASAINLQDGTMYPNLISVYVTKSDGSQITNITPSNSSDWQFSYSIDDGDSWNTISSDQIQTEGDNGMLFKVTNGTITLSEYVPIVKSGINGLNGVTYSLQLSNISLSYAPVDQSYSLQMSCNVNLYKNESNLRDTDANLYIQLNSNDRTSLQYNSNHWVATVDTTVQSKSSIVTIYAYNKNGAYLTSMAIPVSSSGEKGDKGDKGDTGEGSVGQALKGSPLRIRGDFDNSQTYYDGKKAVSDADGVMYQDIVRYNNMYYACVNYDTWESEKGTTQNPETSTAFEPFRISDNAFHDLLIANKANIREISSEEVVIFKGDGNSQGDIVAGMTSGREITSDSYLNEKVKNKGDVRIWAGEMQETGNLASAYTTISDKGTILLQNIEKGKSIYLNPKDCSFKISGPTTIQDGTDLPYGESRTDLVNFDYNVDADGLCSYVKLKLQSNGAITLNPLTGQNDAGVNVYDTNETSKNHSSLKNDRIILFDDEGRRATNITSFSIPVDTDFATITNGYNNKGLHMRRTADDKIIFIIDNLPNTDPGIDGALYVDQSGNLKISVNNTVV